MPKVDGMHFVCRANSNVIDNGDGTFDTGFWKVATSHCDGLKYVALHESKQHTSYRQGRVLGWKTVLYNGANRVVFTVQSDSQPREWVGAGSGEKGYAWR